MKRLLVLVICLLLTATTAAAVDEEGLRPPIYMTITLPNTQLHNIRAQPKKEASTLGQARGENDLYVTSLDGDWATVDSDYGTGYVFVSYLEITAEADCVVRSNGRVRVREKPGGSVAGFVYDSDEVFVKAWRYDSKGVLWARLSTGFVMASYLELQETDDEEQELPN